MARGWIGTSGYDCNHWRDGLYPPELPRRLPPGPHPAPLLVARLRIPPRLHEPIFTLLRDADMPLVLNDMPFQVIVPGETESRNIPRPTVTAPLTSRHTVYLRRHGSHGNFGGSYPSDMTREDADDIARWVTRGLEVYVYFNNDPGAMAVADAAALGRMVEGRAGRWVLGDQEVVKRPKGAG